ncbi:MULTISPECIES: MbtH family NRPS accessory protein [unclassified Bradyrhizobium]|jgi:MbtH protein|uniref:MbtH family protein n=1 Tax=unclassified Bradyrhizobium TaxID=2631580 RepID=UPI001FF5F4DC|nr:MULTISPECIES: MbtH family NRPS accessory protein [unclassified Bradyrhizobium]MCJ9700063.1 MbtH family NRPS accessory protein [Bradyrhizobium sp. SHOUNA76]MCJ9729087.1 MbtH family NRPS accessory protein [Bradyrhizobium sp. PRIMUS42]
MTVEDREDDRIYLVVRNGEEQYSIWPKTKGLPKGWDAVGEEGTKPQCLDYIEKTWTDMRPLSLRLQMQG